MSAFLLFSCFLIGYLSASVQLTPRQLPLRRRIFLLLMVVVTIALLSGYLFYLRGTITAAELYLLLICAGDTAGVLILFERLLQKKWAMSLVAGILIGIINLLLARRHITGHNGLALLMGVLVGGGYLVNGLIRKSWRAKQ